MSTIKLGLDRYSMFTVDCFPIYTAMLEKNYGKSLDTGAQYL